MNPTLDDAKPSTSLQDPDQCSLSAGRTKLSSSSLPPPSNHSSTESPDKSKKSIHFQQSLLISIHLHLLRRLLNTSNTRNHNEPCYSFLILKRDLPTFLNNVGYLSRHFFESAFQAVGVFLQPNTLYLESKEICQLYSVAALFGAHVTSIFLEVKETFEVEDYLDYSNIILGLKFNIQHYNDLEFLNKSFLFFPCLQQLHVDLLKVNTTVTSVVFSFNYFGYNGAIALADALKVNSTVTRICLRVNFIECEGTKALANALQINSGVAILDLGSNETGDAGARALANALTVNTTLTRVNLWNNSIGDEGAGALAEALKVNCRVSIVGIEQLE
ncbi:hypothetical protein GEMRC1_010097 [Eukaryota sp. GEM-RC1]